MNNEKLLVLIILAIFCVGMTMGCATAGHTFKSKGYKYKMSTKEVKEMKKYAKKYVKCNNKVKVSKITYIDSIEKLKVGKKYKMMGGDKIKVLKLVKTYKGSIYGGGGYKYKIKQYAHMNCQVDYFGGKYYFHEKVF